MVLRSVLAVEEIVVGDRGSYTHSKRKWNRLGTKFAFHLMQTESSWINWCVSLSFNHDSGNDSWPVTMSHHLLHLVIRNLTGP